VAGFIGKISGLSKLKELAAGKRVLRAPWKQGRIGEPETEVIRGPLGWMEAGGRRIDLFEPGSPGATSQKWGAIIRIDRFRWKMYLADEHAKKFRFEGGRVFDGNYLFSYVPIDGERVWMMKRLADDDHEKPVKKQEPGFELRIYKRVKTKRIVGGVVYEPDSVDTQGDYTTADEIQEAMYRFMEKYAKNKARIKIQHEGKSYDFPILECFQPEHDIQRGGKVVKAGSWWLMLKVTDPDIWKMVEDGRLNAFSMGGHARA